jgi:hypothetical protein
LEEEEENNIDNIINEIFKNNSDKDNFKIDCLENKKFIFIL